MDKKQQQLGMNPSTAQHRLRMDLLFAFVKAAGHRCFRCGGELTRDSFSIEHKVPWLDTDDPKFNFFDPENIAYSHPACNFGAARRINKYPDRAAYAVIRRNRKNELAREVYTPERRRERYERVGS